MAALQNDRDTLSARTAALEGEVKRLRRELDDEKEKTAQLKDTEVCATVWYNLSRQMCALGECSTGCLC